MLYKLGRINERLKDYDSAIKYYSQLLTQIPTDPVLLSTLGNLYYNINVSIFNSSPKMIIVIYIILKKVSNIILQILII